MIEYDTYLKYALVAQLDRALASDARCRWFESNRVRHERNLICLPNQVSFGFIRLTPSDIVLRVDDE